MHIESTEGAYPMSGPVALEVMGTFSPFCGSVFPESIMRFWSNCAFQSSDDFPTKS